MKSEEQRLKARAAYLDKHYGWTLAMYDALFAEQKGCCACCGRHQSEFTVPLQVDHYHFKIVTTRVGKKEWKAETHIPHGPEPLYVIAHTKKDAVEILRNFALPLSVRGLLCPGRYAGCNRKLGRIDNPQWLENARTYLLSPPAKKVLKNP